MTDAFPHGTVHEARADMEGAIRADEAALALWRALTPLGRNEFICWVDDAKQPATPGAADHAHDRGDGRGEEAAVLLGGVHSPYRQTPEPLAAGRADRQAEAGEQVTAGSRNPVDLSRGYW